MGDASVPTEQPSQEVERITRGTSLAELRGLSDKEVVRRYDVLMHPERGEGWRYGPEDYLTELSRRETERQGRRLEVLTWALFALTAALVVLELLPRVLGEH